MVPTRPKAAQLRETSPFPTSRKKSERNREDWLWMPVWTVGRGICIVGLICCKAVADTPHGLFPNGSDRFLRQISTVSLDTAVSPRLLRAFHSVIRRLGTFQCQPSIN
jgi:hypothetical protein